MMRKYAEAVATKINEESDMFDAEVMEIIKLNDEKNIGVRLDRKDGKHNFGSVHYVNGSFECGTSVEECVKRIMEDALIERDVKIADEEKIVWDEVKDYIDMRLINNEYNEKYLEDKVHKDLGNGFSIMFDVAKGDYRAAITDAFAEAIGCDELALVCASQTSQIGTPVLCDLGERLFSETPSNYLEEDRALHSSMLVLTTKDGGFGASAIYRDGVGDKIKEIVGDYYLLPSSVHEWIVVPESANIPAEELNKMVKEANETVVERKDLLAYGVYRWTFKGLEKVA